MAISCDHCGYRSNEVKAGGGISEKGKKFILKGNFIQLIINFASENQMSPQ